MLDWKALFLKRLAGLEIVCMAKAEQAPGFLGATDNGRIRPGTRKGRPACAAIGGVFPT